MEVDDHMRTGVPNIYASGDVVDKRIPKLTPTAEFESNYIAGQLLGKSDAPIVYPATPNLVLTLPRIAQVGITIDEAKKIRSPKELLKFRSARLTNGLKTVNFLTPDSEFS